ncbi:hypothetical protein [Nocardiopsis lucentensis]|uniref:hypothetical protein n=1 Tax=Nocardiopsis lucentensis TaxID=53441 RepID=UPI00035D6B06|nr:hypothetical protein [Nocardiopsis lucentensis]
MTDHSRAGAARHALLVSACVLVGMALIGTVLGPVWWLLAPDRAVGTALGDGRVFTGTAGEVFAGEAYFALITGAAGMATGYAAYMVQFSLARYRIQDLRMVFLVAGTLGAMAATVLTWQVGTLIDAPLHAAAAAAERGESVTVGLDLRATSFLVVWPFLFVLQYGLLDGISALRSDQPGVLPPAPDPEPPQAVEHPRSPRAADPTDTSATPEHGQTGTEDSAP